MAWMNQETKAELAPAIKAVLKKYKVKATIAVKNHSTLVVNLKSGVLDIIGNYNEVADTRYTSYGAPVRLAEGELSVNEHWYHEHFSGKVVEFFKELIAAMKGDKWFDKSDSQTDYFHTAYYLDVNVGAWNKPYVVNAD